MIEYIKATQSDHNDLIDFLDYVWGSSYSPTNFERLLPGFFTEKNFMAGSNFMARENGKIVANVSSFPATHKVLDEQFKVCSISCVAVHNRARSKGYMKDLMNMAVNDQKESGTALSFLLGNRKRYEYFGYTPCGTLLTYPCRRHNIRHYFKNDFKTQLTLRELQIEDTASYDAVLEMYNKNKVQTIRPRDRLVDIMATWENRTIGVYSSNEMIGYLSATKNYDKISELYLNELSLLPEVLCAYMQKHNCDVDVDTYPGETEIITQLSAFSETVRVSHSMNFNVMDYPTVVNAFLKLKAETTTLIDGELDIGIRGVGTLKITVSNGKPAVVVTNEKPDFEYSHPDAMQLLFSPASAYHLGPLSKNTFARTLLPLPLYLRHNDMS